MSDRVTMPALGESVTEGTVTRWLKNVGDQVAVDEPLLEVSTDKVDTEIPSPFAGTLVSILVHEDETVPVGADLAVIAAAGEPAATPSAAPTGGATPPPAPAVPALAEPVAELPAAVPAPAAAVPSPTAAVPSPAAAVPAPAAAVPAPASGTGGQRVRMPALGESVSEGTVTRWLKAEGDQVSVDEPLLEVSTDKVDTEIPSPYAGVLTTILAHEDETVPVGADLAVIGGSAAPTPAASASVPAPGAPAPAPTPTPAPAPGPAAAPAPVWASSTAQPSAAAEVGGADGSTYVTPLVRKLATQHGVDLGSLTGSGVGGRVRKQDVLDAAKAAQAAAAAAPIAAAPAAPAVGATPAAADDGASKRGTTEKMSRLRKVIAARMVESLQVSAQLTTVIEVDLTKVDRLRTRSKGAFEAREGVKLSYLPFLALAAVDALKAHPTVNASIEGDSVNYHGSVNLSIAVDTDRGLLVPVIKNAGDLSIAGLARSIADLAERTRTNKITPDDLSSGTFTITNTGSRGALFDTPIINQPQVAILGTGSLVRRPVVVADSDGAETIAIRSMMFLALSYDHRLVDGAEAARFLMTLKARLEGGRFEASLGL